MKKNRALLLMLSAALAAGTAAGCSGKAGGNPEAEENLQGVLGRLELEAAKPLLPSQGGAASQVGGANSFALRLAGELLEGADTKGNFVFSPFSVWLPLAAIANATDDTNRPALLKALGEAGVSAEDLNLASSRMLYSLTGQGMDGHDPLAIANAIFVGKDKTINRDFAQAFLDYYRGNVFSIDFSSPEAVRAVNGWAGENTNGLIREVVHEFSPDTVAAIANAISFSDRWASEFDPEKTRPGVFHAPGGDVTAQFMILEGDGLDYYEDSRIQAMPLRFAGGASMLIVKPKDADAIGYLKSVAPADLDAVSSGMTGKTGRLLLPRFEIDSGTFDLTHALKALGLPLFGIDSPPVDGLVEEVPLFISAASQTALIKVDEKGTTAAAVTLIRLAGSSLPEKTDPFEMKCDSPFVFILRGNNGVILFAGTVNQP